MKIMARHLMGILVCTATFALTAGNAHAYDPLDLDPELYIKDLGHAQVTKGDDGKMSIISKTAQIGAEHLSLMEASVKKLPKHADVYRACEMMRGGTKARLIEKFKKPIDVAISNYGYNGSTLVCVLKYMHADQVGTQMIYAKNTAEGMYILTLVK